MIKRPYFRSLQLHGTSRSLGRSPLVGVDSFDPTSWCAYHLFALIEIIILISRFDFASNLFAFNLRYNALHILDDIGSTLSKMHMPTVVVMHTEAVALCNVRNLTLQARFRHSGLDWPEYRRLRPGESIVGFALFKHAKRPHSFRMLKYFSGQSCGAIC